MYETAELRESELLAKIEELRTTSQRALLQAKAFAGLGQTLNSTHSASAAARVIVEVADRLLGWDACTLSLYSSETDTTEPLLKIDTIEGRRVDVILIRATQRPTRRARKVLRGGAQLILREEAVFGGDWVPFGDTTKASASIIVAPIRHGAKIVGVLSIHSYKKQAYNREGLNTLQALADYCGGALDRIRVEGELRESETRFRELAENISEAFWVRDSQSAKILYVSAAYEKIWRRSCENLYESPKSWLKAIHPEDRERIIAAELKQIETAGHDNVYRIIRPDGTLRWVRDRAFPVRNERGEIQRFVGIAQDITDSKLATERILFQASILDQVRNAVIATDPAGKIIYLNKFAETLYRCKPGEVLGKPIAEVLIPREEKRLAKKVQTEISKRGYWEGEFEVRRKDGSIFVAQVSQTAIKDAQAKVIGYVGVSHDATERRRWEDGLRESEQLFTTFMENVPGFAWMKDPQGHYVFLSPATARLSFMPNDWLGKTDDEIWTKEIAAEYKANDQKVIATGKTLQTIESFPDVGARKGYVLVNKFPIFDRAGTVVLVGGISVDITARKMAEEQLQASREQLRALAARLQGARDEESSRIAREIHDVLGQDLTSLNIDLIWLLDRVKQETNQPLRRQLCERLESMESLLKGMVKSVQRLASDLRPAMLDDFGLTSTLEWQAEDFTRRTGIRCQWRRKPDVVNLDRGEATALFRIFQEALTNVARHAGARLVQLTLDQDGDCVVLQIKDDGRGFSESKLLSPESLGLLGMRERALLVGAGLEIRSAPRQGTIVTVVLPEAVTESGDSKKMERTA